jgi:hypothetical protein
VGDLWDYRGGDGGLSVLLRLFARYRSVRWRSCGASVGDGSGYRSDEDAGYRGGSSVAIGVLRNGIEVVLCNPLVYACGMSSVDIPNHFG